MKPFLEDFNKNKDSLIDKSQDSLSNEELSDN